MSIVGVDEVLWYGDLKEERVNGQRVQDLIDAAEAFVSRYCRRQFAPEPTLAADGSDTNPAVTKTFVVPLGRRILRITDLRSASVVALNGNPISNVMAGGVTLGYQLNGDTQEPTTSIDLLQPYGTATYGYSTSVYGNGLLSITGRWGWNPVPPDVKDAIRALTIRMYRERDAAWADSVALPDGSVLSYFRTLPARVQGTLQQYRVPNLALI